MDSSLRARIESFVETNITQFHMARADSLQGVRLKDFLQKKNPYLFRAKGFGTADSLIKAFLDAHISSSEEGKFGNFLEHLALFIASEITNAQKSSSQGLDIDLTRDGIRYLIAVKSGDKWGNGSQKEQLATDFRSAIRTLRQYGAVGHLQPTLGICYGRFKKVNNGLFLKVGGQDFWELISGDPDLYKTLIIPLGYHAKEQNEVFEACRDAVQNRLVLEFMNSYCKDDGTIDWEQLVELSCRNIRVQEANASPS